MKRLIESSGAMAACAALLLTLSGCGTIGPGSGPLALDPVRMVNAIAVDDADYVRGAIESRAVTVNQRVPAPVYMEGTPLLTIAARAGAVDVARYLISAGADVNARTPAGETPLMLAAYFGEEDGASSSRHDTLLRMLVAAGATLDNEMHQYTPLAYAAYQGRHETLRYLLARGARVNVELDDGYAYVNTPLMMAAITGHMDCAVTLLEAGADPRIRVIGGHTARELAEKYRHERLARLLACAERLQPGQRIYGSCLR